MAFKQIRRIDWTCDLCKKSQVVKGKYSFMPDGWKEVDCLDGNRQAVGSKLTISFLRAKKIKHLCITCISLIKKADTAAMQLHVDYLKEALCEIEGEC